MDLAPRVSLETFYFYFLLLFLTLISFSVWQRLLIFVYLKCSPGYRRSFPDSSKQARLNQQQLLGRFGSFSVSPRVLDW